MMTRNIYQYTWQLLASLFLDLYNDSFGSSMPPAAMLTASNSTKTYRRTGLSRNQ